MDERIRQLEREDPLRAMQWKFRLGLLDGLPVIECPRCHELTVPALQYRKKGREAKPTFQAHCRNGKSCQPFQLPQEEPWLSLCKGGPEYRRKLDNIFFNKADKKLEKQRLQDLQKLSHSLNNHQWIQHFILKTPLDELI